MAQRGEGQGLQIAVISFAMLTIILAITTYVFYAQASSASKDVEAKTKQLNDRQTENNKLSYRVNAMQYVLGLKDVTKEQVEIAKSKAGGDDPEVKEILDNFDSDMALVGDQAAPAGPRSYRTFTTALLSTLTKKNASIADAMDQLKAMQQQKDATTAAEKQRADTAVAASDNAVADYDKEKKAFADSRTAMEAQQSQLAAKLTTDATKAKGEMQRISDEKDLFVKSNQQLSVTNKRYRDELETIRKGQSGPTENPDGHIVRVNQKQQMVWIDRGRSDGLLRQTTFSVYDHNESGITSTKAKGRIEVLTVGENMSEARILEDSPANPIIGGDIIETPAWSPGQHIHFALAMKMDVNKDRVDDFDMVKNIIQMNGGVIDAELRTDPSTGKPLRKGDISVETRYFVEGEKPSEATSPALYKEYVEFDKERDRYNVKKISLDNLLALMGWRAEERTVQLSGSSGGFQKRSPGKTQPTTSTEAAPASEGAAPATSAAPVDPFGAPAAAPGAAPADPFGAPAATKTPAADADPFATPK
jgi:hypothetical protein